MHPHFMRWWARHGAAYDFAGCGAGHSDHGRRHRHRGHDTDHETIFGPFFGAFFSAGFDGDPGGGAFGVRRPLRFLSHKLDLDEEQVAELAAILGDLKTERAQAEVDARRATGALADAVAGDTVDAERLADGGGLRVKSAERLRDAVTNALRRIHALLEPEQRRRLAYLIRTGTLRV
jgi:Spy/CpxP family protein refolding chaperone